MDLVSILKQNFAFHLFMNQMIHSSECVLCSVPIVAKNKDYNYETVFLLQSTISVSCKLLVQTTKFNKQTKND